MSNPIYYVIGLVLAVSYPLGIEPLRFAREEAALEAALLAIGAFGAVAWIIHTVLARRRPHQLGPARLALRFLALILYGTLVYVFHFPLWVWSLGLEDSSFFGPLVCLAPLFGFFSALALLGARVDPRREGSVSSALSFAFRGFVGFSLLPIVLLLLIETVVSGIEPLRKMAALYPAAGLLLSVGCMLFFVGLLPFLLRVTFGARPLQAGALRDGLEAICRAASFRSADLYVLPTGGARVANAFIVGLAAPIRGVFFTDSIVSGMTPDLLECVLAHEIAHSRRRHILSFLGGMLGFMLVTAAGLELLEDVKLPDDTRIPPLMTALFALGWTVFLWVGVFGWVSRRFESEADLAAARLAPATDPPPYGAALKMAEALGRVAQLNRIPPGAWSWRHFSIAKRIDLLLTALRNPRTGEEFERRCRRWRVAAAGVFLAGVAALGFLAVRAQSGLGERRASYEAEVRVERGEEFLKAKRIPEALAQFREAVAAGVDRAEVWLKIARCERLFGHEDEAMRAEEVARTKPATDPRARFQLRRP